ncbi:hypothetical protein K2173_000672 [Erythroxylum novogranatense]|uniref:Synergin gamma C-terminal domain-containing protein n=1 Tax=Erythroxylum novogranatense TaxID=1862640 RepID=A0AAV8SI44_9ROSI|nr:hypothetical protein K2173_000672 [Erythroxylum novogranatense]
MINVPDPDFHLKEDDEDWGDFVNSGVGELSHTLSLPATSRNLYPLLHADPKSTSEDLERTQPDSTSGLIGSSVAQWKNPKGALPLSIFGEVEEEEESGAGGPSFGASFFSDTNNNSNNDNKDMVKEGSSGVNLNDVIITLYKQSEAGNGLNPVSNRSNSFPSGSNLDLNVAVPDLSGTQANSDYKSLDFVWDWGNLNQNGSHVGGANQSNPNSQGVDLNWNPLNLPSNGLICAGDASNLSTVDVRLSKDGVSSNDNKRFGNDDDGDAGEEDNDGWEFKAAESKATEEDEISESGQKKTDNQPIPSFNGLDFSWSASSLDFLGWSLNGNGVNSSSNWPGIDEDRGLGDANEQGFKAADIKHQIGDRKSKVKVDLERTETGPISNSSGNSSWNFVSLDSNGMKTNLSEVGLCMKHVDINLENEDLEGDDEWEFKVAESGTQPKYKKNEEYERIADKSGELTTFRAANGLQSRDHLLRESLDSSQRSDEWNFEPDNNSRTLVCDSSTPDAYSNSKEDSVEDSWAFRAAFAQTESNNKGANLSSDSQKRALPLSFFGEEEEEDDNDVIHPNISSQIWSSRSTDGNKRLDINTSFNDLVSTLYSQAEENKSVNHGQNPSENGSASMMSVMAPNSSRNDDDFDDNSWEFKAASSGTGVEDQTFVFGIGETNPNLSSVEFNYYTSFFSKLEEELHHVGRCHLENLKKARNAAPLTGEDAKVEALNKEIQNLESLLFQDLLSKGGINSDSYSPNKTCLDKLVQVMQEPKFQLFDSEYQLSKKVSAVESNPGLAVELLKLVALILKILTLLSQKDQFDYVSTWFKMLSTCAQELIHGAFIWKQSLQKNVHHQILSQPTGRRYILALSEVYRVVEVLGISARLYKPWILACPVDHTQVFTLLSECSTLWSSSGLEEAMNSILDMDGFESDGRIKTLLQSIKCIHDIDVHTVYNHIFSGQEPTCRLSALTLRAVPGMKMVEWNGDPYFLTLANLWANLVSCDPPNLPFMQFG